MLIKHPVDKFQKVAASNLKDSAADSFNAFDKDGHFAKYASFAAGFSGAMHSMSNSMSAVWQKSMYGDPSAGKGGYLDVVTGGAFSKKQSGSVGYHPFLLPCARNADGHSLKHHLTCRIATKSTSWKRPRCPSGGTGRFSFTVSIPILPETWYKVTEVSNFV